MSRTSTMNILCIAYGAKIIFVIAGLPLDVPSIRKYIFLLQHIFYQALVPYDVADLLLVIPSNLNKLCPLQNAFTWPRIMFVLIPFSLLNPPGIISLSFTSSSQHSRNHIGCSWPLSGHFSSVLSSTGPGCYCVMLTSLKTRRGRPR